MQRLSLAVQRGNAARIICQESEINVILDIENFSNIGRGYSGSGLLAQPHTQFDKQISFSWSCSSVNG